MKKIVCRIVSCVCLLFVGLSIYYVGKTAQNVDVFVEDGSSQTMVEEVVVPQEVEVVVPEKVSEEGIPKIIDILVQDGCYFALCEDKSVWCWEEHKGIDTAEQMQGVEEITKIVDAGEEIYALSEKGDIYAWGSGEEPIRRKDISDVVELDAANGRVFALDADGNFYVWGLYLYGFENESNNYKPGFSEESKPYVKDVKSIFAGAGNYHYFLRENGSAFSIMESSMFEKNVYDFIFPQFPMNEQKAYRSLEDMETLNLADLSYVDLREGTKYAFTILYELEGISDVEMMESDAYTMFVYGRDRRLWYWDSYTVRYHDNKEALAEPETGSENYNGIYKEVDVRSILGLEEADELPVIIDICSGKENVFFLTDDGQVFMSEYVTSETKDVEYYYLGSTKPDRDPTRTIKEMDLKTLSFYKLNLENIVSINSDGEHFLYAVDEAGEYFVFDADYSVQLSKIIEGDYCEINDEEIAENLKVIFEHRSSKLEWIWLDMNQDGSLDLILQETDEVKAEMRRVIGIFTTVDDNVETVLWDVNDSTEFHYIEDDGLRYYMQYYGTHSYEDYQRLHYDTQWNLVIDGGNEWYLIEDKNELPQTWSQDHPEMAEEGEYYWQYDMQYIGGTWEKVNRKLLKKEIAEITYATGPANHQNPYFYNLDRVQLSADVEYYGDDGNAYEGVVNLEIYKVKEYEDGELFHLRIEPMDNGESYLNETRLNIYLYVTDDKIYRLWPYEYQDDEVITFYDDDETAVRIWDTEDKMIENGVLICQMEDTGSDLKDGEYGMHYDIKKVGNQIHYRRYNVKVNGETDFYEWFTWEEGKGLVEYGSGYRAEADILYLSDIQIGKREETRQIKTLFIGSCIYTEQVENRNIEIYYPHFHGIGDSEQEERINALILEDVKKVVLEDNVDLNVPFCAYLDYDVEFVNENIISICYKGMCGYSMPGQGLSNIVLTTNINIAEGELITLNDIVVDFDALANSLLEDRFESITEWDGISGNGTNQ